MANSGKQSPRFRRLGRRQLVRAAGRLALAALATPLATRATVGNVRFGDYPFKLGVASGESTTDGFVIWTRLAPQPLLGGGMPRQSVEVAWQVARDEALRDVVSSGTAIAAPEHGHAVHVEVSGLEPDRWYWYRFLAGGEASPIGRSRTFPAGAAQRLRLAFGSCQHFGQGYFVAYRQMLEDDLDLILFLGDYIYESTWGPVVRPHLPEPTTLDGYRNHHALYKMDPMLQQAHRAYPWLVTWDDHEVDNDYAGFNQEDRDPLVAFARRRAAAYKAFFEHMPLRLVSRPRGAKMQLYRALPFGDLADIILLDNRQFRDDQACQGPEDFGGQVIGDDCVERLDPNRSVLGEQQEKWLQRRLAERRGRWTLLAQQTLFSPMMQRGGWASDRWDGYPAARQRLIDDLVAVKPTNPVFVGGDLHQFWACDVKKDFAAPKSETLATEFVCTSITSGASGWAERHLKDFPHVRFHDWRYRGYGRAELSRKQLRMDFMAVDDVTDVNARIDVLRSFVVEDGRPGILDA